MIFQKSIFYKIMHRSKFRGLTPLCIAGSKKNYKSLETLIEFLSTNSEIIKELFPDEIKRLEENAGIAIEGQILLTRFDIKGLSEEQVTFLTAFYWAAYSGMAKG
jgi:hypothetical protein